MSPLKLASVSGDSVCAFHKCASGALPGKTRCAEHAALQRDYTNKRNAERRANGVCPCGRNPLVGKKICQICRDKNSAIYRQRRADGICISCTNGKLAVAAGKCLSCWFRMKAQDALETRGAVTTPVAEALAYMWEQQNGVCALTGEALIPGANASIDHKIPRSRGGSHELSNLQWVTLSANLAKRNLTQDEFLALCKRVIAHERQR